MRQVMCVFKLNKKTGKYQEGAHEESPKDASIFNVEDRSTQQPKSLSHKAYKQIYEEETGKAKGFEWLLSHEVRDKNVNYSAEHLDE